MIINLTDMSDEEIEMYKKNCEFKFDNRPIFTDMTDYYSDQLYKMYEDMQETLRKEQITQESKIHKKTKSIIRRGKFKRRK